MGKQKNEALNKKVHNEDKDLIDKFCYDYIHGSKEEAQAAQAKILEYFDSYLEKYVGLLQGEDVNLDNYDTRLFLGMFLTGRPKTHKNLLAQRKYISSVMSNFTKEDIKSELIVIFLTVLSKYRIVKGVNALNPLTKIFKWRLKDWFNKIARDPLFKTVDISDFNADDDYTLEDFIDSAYNSSDQDLSWCSSFDDALYTVSMDLAWIDNPAQSFYRVLTSYERYLISLVFRDDLSITQISDRMCRDKDTIKRHLEIALDKLRSTDYE